MSKTTIAIAIGLVAVIGLGVAWKLAKGTPSAENMAAVNSQAYTPTGNAMTGVTQSPAPSGTTTTSTTVATDAQLDAKMNQTQTGLTKLDGDQKAVDQINQSADTPPQE